jgi:hypothetical protein
MQTVKYFKSIEHVHQSLIGQENLGLQGELLSSEKVKRSVKLSRDMMVRRLMNAELSDDEDDDIHQFKDLHKAQKKRRLTMTESPSP